MPMSVDDIILDELEEIFGDEGYFPNRTRVAFRVPFLYDHPAITLMTFQHITALVLETHHIVIMVVPPLRVVATVPFSDPDLYDRVLGIVDGIK